MSTWTDEEIRELISLWPTNSAMQIAKRLHRPRSAICGKARRLHAHGVLPYGEPKHYEVDPWPSRPRRPAQSRMIPPPQSQNSWISPNDGSLAMRPCSIIELDVGRCHWPLGETYTVAAMFCGGAAVPGHSYCAQHMRMAHDQGRASWRA